MNKELFLQHSENTFKPVKFSYEQWSNKFSNIVESWDHENDVPHYGKVLFFCYDSVLMCPQQCRNQNRFRCRRFNRSDTVLPVDMIAYSKISNPICPDPQGKRVVAISTRVERTRRTIILFTACYGRRLKNLWYPVQR